MSRLCCLPDEVLKLVMQYIPLKERLGSCCFVNRRLHGAAVAATTELDINSYYWCFRDDASDLSGSLLMWLHHYGQQLTHLTMERFPQLQQQLPCSNLRQLVLADSCVQLGPAADGTPGVLQNCTKLTKLGLRCRINDIPHGAIMVDSMSRLLQLEHLYVAPKSIPFTSNYSVGGLHSSTLPCLKHLTHLEVRSLSLENLQQLGGLTNLQELHLWAVEGITVGPSSAPGFSLPSALTKLVLSSPVEAGWLSLVPAGLKDLTLTCRVEGAVEAPSWLLSCAARLQHLTRLYLDPSLTGDVHWPPSGPAYSALTASSNLVELCVQRIYGLPVGIWQHVFPANRCLSQFTRLELNLPENLAAESPALTGAWGAADVSSFVSCCRNVVEIDALYLQHGAEVCSQLQQLTVLTALAVNFVASDMSAFRGSLEGLAAVTQLKRLRLKADTTSPDEVSEAGLLPLTSLTRLTQLRYVCWSVDPGDLSANKGPELDENLEQEGPEPDVWLQLLERCAAEPGCQPTVLRSMAQQLAAQQQQIAAQQQQLAVQQQVVAGQGAQIAGLQAQLQELLQRQTQQQ